MSLKYLFGIILILCSTGLLFLLTALYVSNQPMNTSMYSWLTLGSVIAFFTGCIIVRKA